MVKKEMYRSILAHFPDISKGFWDGDQVTFSLKKAGNQEVRAAIIHCSGQGCYNLANNYFRMIDKTIGPNMWYEEN